MDRIRLGLAATIVMGCGAAWSVVGKNLPPREDGGRQVVALKRLAAEVSANGGWVKTWRWRADGGAPEWTVMLPSPEKASSVARDQGGRVMNSHGRWVSVSREGASIATYGPEVQGRQDGTPQAREARQSRKPQVRQTDVAS